MKLFVRTTLLAAVVFAGLSGARAELIVGTETEGNGGYGVGFSFDSDTNLAIAQQFGLNQAVVAGAITVYLNGDGTDNPQGNFELQLMDAIGPDATSANVLWSGIGTFPTGTPEGHAPVTFSGLTLPLDAGEYFLVISSGAGPGTGWGNGALPLPGGVGTVGVSYVGIASGGAIADYTYFDPNNFNEGNANFRIDSVPEPGSVALLFTGGALLVVALRRRRI